MPDGIIKELLDLEAYASRICPHGSQNKAVTSADKVLEGSRRNAEIQRRTLQGSANKTVRIRQSSQQIMFQNVPEGTPSHTRLPLHTEKMSISAVTARFVSRQKQ